MRSRPVSAAICNPPQSTTRPLEHAHLLQVFEAGTARPHRRPQIWSRSSGRVRSVPLCESS
eukprot:13937943-Alexandrium_andersonii.AAC.1